MGLIGHSPAAAALPILFAGTAPDANAMVYYGPSGLFELKGRGWPGNCRAEGENVPLARRLWEVSTGRLRTERSLGVPTVVVEEAAGADDLIETVLVKPTEPRALSSYPAAWSRYA